jgi:hypothetical protein
MKTSRILATLALVALVGSALAAEKIASGPQVGKNIPGPFHPLNITGKAAGEKNCLVCQNGDNPVAMVFARETSPGLTKLMKKIDEATGKNSTANMGSFVVFLNDKEGLDKELLKMAREAGLKHLILSIDNPAGPKDYQVAKDADVTVVLYTQRNVKANHAFKKGELKDADIDAIVADVAKIVPAK